MKRLAVIVFIGISLIVMSCNRPDKIPASFSLLDRTEKGELKVVELTAPVEIATYERDNVHTGYSSLLTVGDYEEHQAKALVRFDSIPDSGIVESATLTMNPLKYYGESPSITINVHQVVADWDENEVTWDTFGDAALPDLQGTVDITPKDTSNIEIDLGTELINNWIDSTAANYGYLLDFLPTSSMVELYSSETIVDDKYPILTLIYNDGSADTIKMIPSEDAFIVDFYGTPPENRSLITNATGWRTLMKFNLNDIPENAGILRARFEMWIDQESSLIDEAGMLIGIRPVTSSSWYAPSVTVDSTVDAAYSTLIPESESLTHSVSEELVNFSGIVQRWVAGELSNYGMLLYSAVEGLDVEKVVFYTGASDTSRAPKLIIEYSVPAVSQF